MDPISLTASASAILAICLQAVHLIQNTIETVRNSRKLLVKLLSQTERLRLNLEQLRSLTKQLGNRGGISLAYNDSAPRQTIQELHRVVMAMASGHSYLGLQVLLNKGKVDDLLDRLRRHEQEILSVLLSIATETAVRTEDEVIQMHEETKAQSEVLVLFEDYFTSRTDALNTTSSYFKPSRSLQIWFGDTYRDGFSDEYLSLRDRLSDAAYIGNFETVFSILDIAKEKFGESWVNAPRLGRDPKLTSGWTALHQAAFMSAPPKTITRLLDYGALKTMRTAWANPTELSYPDLTAGEIARELGSAYMYELLTPRIQNGIPASALQKLQHGFHELIKGDFAMIKNHQYLRLPDLFPLTELEVPEMWFPLKAPGPENPRWVRGYLYRLDCRVLLVQVLGIQDDKDSRLYRISQEETHKIVDGVTFNTAAVVRDTR